MVAFVLLASGCQAAEPIVPREVYQKVNDDGREWTYDTAWQNIRQLNADLEAGTFDTLAKDALFITSQMERLETGKATHLGNRWALEVVTEMSDEEQQTSRQIQERLVRERALELQDAFDAGDFARAKEMALEVYLLTRNLDSIG
ncbi:MAG: hypothetical protein VW917_04945 [Pontimonas sp.]